VVVEEEEEELFPSMPSFTEPSKVEHFYFVTRANRGFTRRGGQAADDDDF
jgi:hypothetical protein